MEYIILNNQIEMPILGLGVFQVPDKKECQETVFQAIKAGYRLIKDVMPSRPRWEGLSPQ